MILIRSLCTLLVAAAVMLSACGTPSVHPIYGKDDDISDERLVGSWTDEEGKSTYTVSKTDKAYCLHVGSPAKDKADKPVDNYLELHLVEIGAHRYVDIAAAAAERSRVGDKHGTLFVPTHMFARVELHADTATVWTMKNDFVRQAVVEKSISGTPLDESEHGSVLITSETDKLLAFIRNQAENAEAWERIELHRVKYPAPK